MKKRNSPDIAEFIPPKAGLIGIRASNAPLSLTGSKERCREYIPAQPGIPAHGCRGYVPGGKSMESFACQQMHLCRKCYLEKFPRRKMWNLPANRHGSEKVLTASERQYLASRQFEGMEVWLWEPEFYYEWLDALYE